ncbi:membrane protein [Leminorella grimontii]|uniref:Membrane protein n=2 Tax=Leminorella grimontii TaxID=82981 RepID=A0AAV5N0X6_9GAMM|nr:substrate-binding component of an ABC superfamily Fe2+ transporter [Leminorella grimontii ATCC 33999 = DSM 5078]GKX54578.1 membrane protein [Leminorella grimontii]VFS58888.1 Predicted membrane protein [Leminorella grimontii]
MMNYFLVSVLQAFLPVSLLLGVSWAPRQAPGLRPVVWLSLLGFLVGAFAGIHFPRSQQWTLFFTLFQLASIVLFLVSQRVSSRRVGYFWLFILILLSSVRWGQTPNLSAITATGVVNTDLILNVSAVLGGIAFVAASAALIAACVSQLRFLRWPLIIALALILLAPVSGELMLALMKLQAIGLTKSLLSYVAKVTNAWALINYVSALILLITVLVYLLRVVIPRAKERVQSDPIAHRKALARYFEARRTMVVTLLLAAAAFGAQLYWDKVASQPPRLSEAQPVLLADDGMVHIPIEQVKDGKLHRFVWVADDGKAVRFFVINRYPDKLRLGVVFDACLLCGDQGYVMEGNQVICVACDVHIFIPSIGKPGGCNPVPIDEWSMTDTELTIGKKALESGLNYFNTVITLEVTDPVDGSRLTNTKAEHRYTFAGKTYFFSNEANFEAFRDNPEKYVQEAK